MDELSLRELLEHATSPEPPLGPIVSNSLRAGRTLRRRRRVTGAASLSAVAVVVVSTVPALTSGAGHKVGKPGPAAVAEPLANARTAYVATSSDTVVPVSLASNSAGRPIKVPGVIDDPFVIQAGASPNGRTVYEVGMTGGNGATVTPIDTATNTAGPVITIKKAEPQYFAVAPNGKTAYLSTPEGLFRISAATNTASNAPDCSRSGCRGMAFTPDGKALYVIGGAKTVIMLRTASNTVLARIKIPAISSGIPFNIGITPNGKTAYVVDGTAGAKPGQNSVVPINLATRTPLAPIKIWAPGLADGLVIAPDGRTAYVLSSRAVTPIDTATNQAEPAVELPESAGYAYFMALTPDGKTLYVLTPRGVVPIRTGSGTVLPTIKVPKLCGSSPIAVTPDARTVYVGACITRPRKFRKLTLHVIVGGGVVPISTATNTAGPFINLGGAPVAITFAR